MPFDALAVLQAAVTKTATFNGTGFDLQTRAPLRGVAVSIDVTAVSGTSPTCTFIVQESSDNSTFNDHASTAEVTAVGKHQVQVTTNKRYVRLRAVIGGTTPSFDYSARFQETRGL